MTLIPQATRSEWAVLGRFLFRWRGVIGLAAFVFVFCLARPTTGSCLFALPLLLVGLAVRFWASGYIGIEGRAREIGASRRIANGPYRLLRHPLYIGNSLLVAGMLAALRPALWLGAAVLVGFVVEYILIMKAEEEQLSGLGCNSECKLQNAKCKMADGGKDEAGSVGLGRNAECKVQDAKCKMADANGEWRMAKGDSFLVRRALCEWRTWVVTGVAFGLALFRAAIRS